MKKFLVTIVGPTAVGKTKVSIHIARHFNSEIISADARQFYREMNIGTAKPSTEDQNSVPHHFIGHLSVEQQYSAGDFEKETIEKLDELYKRHNVVIITGGSGLFIKAVLKGLDTFPDVDDGVEEELKRLFEFEGIEPLQQLLKAHDPEYYTKVDRKNPHRLLRALAVCISTGKPYSSFLKLQPAKRNFIPIQCGLELERKILYQRIDERVDRMMQDGLLEEVKQLQLFEKLNPLQTVGYQELFRFLHGEINLEQAVDLIKQHTRNYAKRQMTWFRKEKEIAWFHPDQWDEMVAFIERKVNIGY